jgi:nucleoid-associated protein YgaU
MAPLPFGKGANSLTPPVATAPIEEQSAAEHIHIVHEGDSLERLARRYLDDAGRAMEIFELNRQVLNNPHLLPLGAELRIPAKDRLPKDRSASGGKDVK